jgi:very-short-patch-repair endonuclease
MGWEMKTTSMDEYRRLTGQTPKIPKTAKERSPLEVLLLSQIRYAKLPEPQCEYKFLADRRFRFDFAWVELKLACEIEGGIWMRKGAHNTGAAIIRDCKKGNLATMHGWAFLRYTSEQIENGEALNQIEQAIKERMK